MRRSSRLRSPSAPLPRVQVDGSRELSDEDEITPTGRQPPQLLQPPRSVLKPVKASQPVVARVGRRVRLQTFTTGSPKVHRVHSPARKPSTLPVSAKNVKGPTRPVVVIGAVLLAAAHLSCRAYNSADAAAAPPEPQWLLAPATWVYGLEWFTKCLPVLCLAHLAGGLAQPGGADPKWVRRALLLSAAGKKAGAVGSTCNALHSACG